MCLVTGGYAFGMVIAIRNFLPDAMVNTDNFSPAGIDVNRGGSSQYSHKYLAGVFVRILRILRMGSARIILAGQGIRALKILVP